jgi:hypothetical protein
VKFVVEAVAGGRQTRLDAMADVAKPVTLKVLAESLSLSKTTVSMVLNQAPGARTIAPATRQRVEEAAVRLGYRPNVHAHMLGSRQRGTDAGEGAEEREAARVDGVEAQTRRVFELEQENARLRRLVAELYLDKGLRRGGVRGGVGVGKGAS